MNNDTDANSKNIVDETGLNSPEVDKSLSPVATMPGKNMLAAGAVALIVLAVLFRSFVFNNAEQVVEEEVLEVPEEFVKPAKPVQFELPVVPVLPDPPSIQAPEPQLAPQLSLPEELPAANNIAPPPVQVKSAPTPPIDEPTRNVEIAEEYEEEPPKPVLIKPKKISQERMNAGMFAFGGSEGLAEGEESNESNAKLKHDFRLEDTNAESVKVTFAGDMSATIAQGKIIDAILETAVNTDLAGTVRAIVSRDVYSESGKNVLIPKGSRVIGSYNGESIAVGQKRIAIIWTRIIRPEGIDIQINSPSVDSLGRSGADGLVNNKYFEILTNAILISTANVLWTSVMESTLGSDNDSTDVTTVSSDGTTTTASNQSETDKAIEDGLSDFSDLTNEIGENATSGMQPTFTIDQGKKIKIFVNRDLVFPYSVSGGANILQ